MFVRKPKLTVEQVLSDLYTSDHTYEAGLLDILNEAEVEFEALLDNLDGNYNIPLKCEEIRITQNKSKTIVVEKKTMLNYYRRLRGNKWGYFKKFFYPIGISSCPYCGSKDASTLDHILPKDEYIKHAVIPANLVRCCDTCNRNKKIFVSQQAFYYPYFEEELYSFLRVESVDFIDSNMKIGFSLTDGKYSDLIDALRLKERVTDIIYSEITSIIMPLVSKFECFEDIDINIILEELESHSSVSSGRRYIPEAIKILSKSSQIDEYVKAINEY
ncbi:HNH endonuclease [Brochothrix thermosphacta]|uniref:HNH endonuclease n=1 Tax=Brochothrix thermosphacta TaxID=2756 RepID=A0A1D2KDP6_BROTH|nr:HNH endonuclease signature motif containing protein [Brochothrix thermosphacta]ATF25133.1 HNH endonuclease [Brochothrix thermosphacta]ATH84516.1 HNH endonuclease [Brochothrix thermosphacta]MPQ27564.1 HNH endonuclease [Brochothrix thermosphacta]ODJ55836.1 hypothetical protein BFR38_07595 [Brochothrix thermosphacta]ODJ60817.1 hypothetical protein BFR42_02555 [Brochothrix thermosphacta]